MAGNFILDTNIIIALFNNDENIKKQISKAKKILVPAIVMGDLFYGANNSEHKEKNLKKIIEFCNEVQILSCDI